MRALRYTGGRGRRNGQLEPLPQNEDAIRMARPMDKYLDMAAPWAIVFLSGIPHEIAHGTVALKCGDSTALRAGRLSWDPRVHFDWMWTVVVPLVLLAMSGGRMCLWGLKPVPINPYYLRNIKRDIILVSIAGPLTNLAIMLVFFLLALIPGFVPAGSWNEWLFARIIWFNLILFLFNLLPIPPLDGFGVLEGLLPRSLEGLAGFLRAGGIMLLLIAMSSGLVDLMLQPVDGLLEQVRPWSPNLIGEIEHLRH